MIRRPSRSASAPAVRPAVRRVYPPKTGVLLHCPVTRLACMLRTLRAVLGALPPQVTLCVGRSVPGIPLSKQHVRMQRRPWTPRRRCCGCCTCATCALCRRRSTRRSCASRRGRVPGGPARAPGPWQALPAEHFAAERSWACGEAACPSSRGNLCTKFRYCLVVNPPSLCLAGRANDRRRRQPRRAGVYGQPSYESSWLTPNWARRSLRPIRAPTRSWGALGADPRTHGCLLPVSAKAGSDLPQPRLA